MKRIQRYLAAFLLAITTPAAFAMSISIEFYSDDVVLDEGVNFLPGVHLATLTGFEVEGGVQIDLITHSLPADTQIYLLSYAGEGVNTIPINFEGAPTLGTGADGGIFGDFYVSTAYRLVGDGEPIENVLALPGSSSSFLFPDLVLTDIFAPLFDGGYSAGITLIGTVDFQRFGSVGGSGMIVPIPAAAWLFASGLCAFVGMRRESGLS